MWYNLQIFMQNIYKYIVKGDFCEKDYKSRFDYIFYNDIHNLCVSC